MNKTNSCNRIFIATLVSGLAISCGPGSGDAQSGAEQGDTTIAEETSTVDELRHFMFHKTIANIPYPASDVYSTVKGAEQAFDTGLLNSTDKFPNYVTSHAKALAFGVYSVDLVYLAIYDRQSELKRYFAVSRKLAGDLDLQDTFDKAVSSNVMDNAENTDSVLAVINSMYGDIDGYLRTNERVDAATSMLIGSWVESQHIVLSTIAAIGDGADGNFEADYGYQVFQQKLTLFNLLNMLEEMSGNEDYAEIIKGLKAVNAVYADIHSSDDVKERIPALLESIRAVRATITG
jgi:hypothetical protein